MNCNDIWYDHFIETLYERYPQRPQLTQALTELLFIEREAVYRRLRKDVVFPAHEIMKIASAWNISLDEITGISNDHVPFLMRPVNYINPSDKELNRLYQLIQFLGQLKDSPDSEYMEIGNKLPRSLFAGFEQIHRFYLFKWMYQYGGEDKIIPFSKIGISEKKLRLTSAYYYAMKNVANVSYIWDQMLFEYLACDIRYFYSIQLITDKDKERIKRDLYNLLDYMSEVAAKGSFPETNNKVNLYISRINIDTNYSYIYTNELKAGHIHAFGKHEVCTSDADMIENIRTWLQLKKRSSGQISETNEKQRIEYFMKQRQLITEL